MYVAKLVTSLKNMWKSLKKRKQIQEEGWNKSYLKSLESLAKLIKSHTCRLFFLPKKMMFYSGQAEIELEKKQK